MQKSESIKNLANALAKFQSEIENPKNTTENPFFKSTYAPLNEILTLVRGALSKHGLAIIQSPSGDGININITTMLIHESGEFIESDILTVKADKPNAQSAGSAITYARRYAICSILGISGDDDDDGNEAIEATNQTELISEAQAKRIFGLANGNIEIVKEILSKYKYSSTKSIKKSDYEKICKEIENKLQ